MNPPRLVIYGFYAAVIILILVAIFRPHWLIP